jgi:hypothetical protein
MKRGFRVQTHPRAALKLKKLAASEHSVASRFEKMNRKFEFCLESLERIFQTELSVCMSGTSCREMMGYSKGPLHLPSARRNDTFEFMWMSQREQVDGVKWQVSTQPFPCAELSSPPGLIKEGVITHTGKLSDKILASFTVDFGAAVTHTFNKRRIRLSAVGKDNRHAPLANRLHAVPKKTIASRIDFIAPIRYYIRTIPIVNHQPVMGCSNTIEIRFDDLPEEATIEVVKPEEVHFPDIYNVSIESFTPIQYPTQKWGSQYVVGFDETRFKQTQRHHPGNAGSLSVLRASYQNAMEQHRPLVPDTYRGEGSPTWYESFWDATSSATNWVSESYAWAKEQVVEVAANLVDTLPGLECGQDCHALLKKGLEAGMLAAGIPPDIPNAQQLIDEGAEYVAAEIASQAGCGEICKDAIRNQLDELGERLNERNRAISANEEEAHKHGVEPLNIPDWVITEMVPESTMQPAKLVLKIDRNAIDVSNDPKVDLESYFIQVSFSCTNTHYRKGKKIRAAVNTDYRDGFRFGDELDELVLPSDPWTPLWESKLIKIPNLAQNTSITIPLSLSNMRYLFPGHLNLIRQHGGHIYYDDWGQMYMLGELTIRVALVGKHTQAISWREVYDELKAEEFATTLPNEGYNNAGRIQ